MKPIEVNDVLLAFPASVSHLLPDYKTIPEKFKAKNPWSNVFNKLFFGGKGISFIPKEDIDPSLAWRHIRCVMGSYEPKHEHKEAPAKKALCKCPEACTACKPMAKPVKKTVAKPVLKAVKKAK